MEKHIIVHDGSVHRALNKQVRFNHRMAVLTLAFLIYIYRNEKRIQTIEEKLKEILRPEGE